ncbi:hypothetical protein [Virgibacillus halodenitrificans]|uniref:hypothetical protein n=2 Tax=Virgibacillus halodenitrificans TaxID=1482 RepID=UPI001FB3FB29|nr:hypothetical protein [Virgibacillus halodenitrificans]MCJ0930462.1 hypothetical protein [Virgibacillus halodenitrificans]MEC2158793.1 hypothetical protein [Virgibacillus halodenitrificans]
MEEAVSLSSLKVLVEKKIKKKTLIKVIWNEEEKITLLITPNMKINSFIYDQKEGYLFYDLEGKVIDRDIPCVLPESVMAEGKVLLNSKLQINHQPITDEDKTFLINMENDFL